VAYLILWATLLTYIFVNIWHKSDKGHIFTTYRVAQKRKPLYQIIKKLC